jgi:hypothetical protein
MEKRHLAVPLLEASDDTSKLQQRGLDWCQRPPGCELQPLTCDRRPPGHIFRLDPANSTLPRVVVLGMRFGPSLWCNAYFPRRALCEV